MRSKIITGIVLLFVVLGAFAPRLLDAQEAVIRELTGTVELKKPGSAAWENAVQGQSITVDTIISTGFKSYAVISIGNSSLSVRPLTRLSLTEIRASQATETINVNLQAGRMRVDVKPPAGTSSSFTARTPPATASVRGTVFELATFDLWVIEGSVEYRGTSGPSIVVDAAGHSYIDEKTGRAALAKEFLLESLDPAQPIAFDSFHSFQGSTTQQSSEIEITGCMEFD